MKSLITLLLALSCIAHAQEIEELPMSSGRPLKDVVIVGVTKDGVKLKSRSGARTVEFKDIDPESAALIGAATLPPSPPGSYGVLDMQRKVIEFDPAKKDGETKSQHAARVTQARQDARRWADDHWRKVEAAEKLAAEQRKEGIDTKDTNRKAAEARGLAIAFEFAYARLIAAK